MEHFAQPNPLKPMRFITGLQILTCLLVSSAGLAQAPPPTGLPQGAATSEQSEPVPGAAKAEISRPPVPQLPVAEITNYLAAPELNCDYASHWQAGERLWVACGAAGLLELKLVAGSLKFVSQRQLGGVVDGFFSADGTVWVTLLERRALALAQRTGSSAPPRPMKPRLAPAPLTEPESAPAPKPVGSPSPLADPDREIVAEVVGVSELDVIISAGSFDGLVLRDRVALHQGGSLVAGGETDQTRGRVVVGRVIELWDTEARVRVGMNEGVRVGAVARLSKELPTASRVGPPRIAGVWEFRAVGRPFFSLGEVGGGIMAEGSIARRSKRWHYGLRLGQTGIAGKSGQESIAPWSAYVFGEFDSRLFGAGFGLGAQSVIDTDVEPGSGLSIVQSLRLGSVDGLHLSGRTSFVVFRSETSFSTLDMQGQLAVGNASWLIARGGGGSVGHGFGEVALRTLLWGYGGPGSFFLEVAVGGAAFHESSCLISENNQFMSSPCTSSFIGGPMAGLGGEWRL